MEDSIRLDGRDFEGVSDSLSAAQDDYILAHLRQSGATEVLSGFDGKKRDEETRARDMLTAILLSGRKFHILAGCLTEHGLKWSRIEADRNAQLFSEITDPLEKSAMNKSVVGFVIGFFRSGEASPATSRKSSSRKEKDLPTRSAAAATSATSPQ